MAEPSVQVPVSLIERLRYMAADHDAFTAAEWDAAADNLAALLSQSTPTAEPDRTPCTSWTPSWDHFRPGQVDSYWITCDLVGPHDEHEDQHTGLTWTDSSATTKE